MVAALRKVCLALPSAYEEEAWVGTRWRVRKQTFAHVLQVEQGWPPAYAKAAGSRGPITVLTFRSSDPELQPRGRARPGLFRPGWFPDLAGLVLTPSADWDEIARLILESYCLLAPRRLVQSLIDREST